MRQYQRDLIAKADFSSRLAASPFSAKPDAPRLDPLGSPGPVTPLALEEDSDYLTAGSGFAVNDSPCARSDTPQKDTIENYVEREGEWKLARQKADKRDAER